MENEKYYIFAECDGDYKVIDPDTYEIKRMSFSETRLLPKRYDMLGFAGHTTDDASMIDYVNQFKKWEHELRNNDILSIHWTNYDSNNSAINIETG